MGKPWFISYTLDGSNGAGGGGSSAAMVASDGTGQYLTIADALTAGEKVIAIKRGSTYDAAQTISQSDVTIVGYGATFTSQTAAATFTITGTNVTIEGVTITGSFDGDPANLGSSTNGTAFHVSADGCVIDNVTVTDISGFGVWGAANHITVKNSTFHNVALDAGDELATEYCLYFIGFDHCKAFNNDIRGWHQAIGYWYSSYGEAHSNDLIDNYGYIWSGSELGTRSAIEIYGEDDAEVYHTIVHHNHIDGATSACLELADKLRGVHVHHNYCANFGAGNINGIGVAVGAFGITGSAGDEGYDVAVEDNYIVGRGATTVAGCALWGLGIKIQRNTFVDYVSSEGCINSNSNAPAHGARLNGNTFRNCGRSIYLESGATSVGVQCHENHVYGIAAGVGESMLFLGGEGHDISHNFFYDLGSAASIRANREKCRTVFNTVYQGGIMVVEGDGHNSVVMGNLIVGDPTDNTWAFQTNRSRLLVMANIMQTDGYTLFNNGGQQSLALLNLLLDEAGTGEGPMFNNQASWLIDTQLAPNNVDRVTPTTIANQTVGTSETTIAHGLGYIPSQVWWKVKDNGYLWESTAADATNVYLTGSAASLDVDVYVR